MNVCPKSSKGSLLARSSNKTALYLLFASVFIFCGFGTGHSQDIDLEKFLDKADKAGATYFQTFKNLVAEELKTYEYFRRDGTVEDSRKIRSVFVVYQSTKNNAAAEYRNVIEFNGKNVARSDDSIQSFFEKLGKTASSREEIDKINKEGDRFDGRSHSHGMTLMPAFVLNKNFRPFFEFQIVGREKIEGREAVVVAYRQTKHCPWIKANATDEEKKAQPSGITFDADVPPNFRPTNPRLDGKMWLDAETGQLWRNDFSVTIQPAVLTKPVLSANLSFEYRSSEFGILLPKKMSTLSYRFEGKNDSDLTRTKAQTKTFEYSKFTRPASEIKETKTGTF